VSTEVAEKLRGKRRALILVNLAPVPPSVPPDDGQKFGREENLGHSGRDTFLIWFAGCVEMGWMGFGP